MYVTNINTASFIKIKFSSLKDRNFVQKILSVRLVFSRETTTLLIDYQVLDIFFK